MLRHRDRPQQHPSGSIELIAPTTGHLVPLEQVPDLMYSQHVLGPGVAIEAQDALMVTPITGVITTSERTPYAYFITDHGGRQVLVHLGLDSHRLDPSCFQPLVTDGQRAEAGEPLCVMDLDRMRAETVSTLCPVVVTRSPEDAELTILTSEARGGSTAIARLVP